MLRRCRVLLLLGFLEAIRLVRSAEQELPVVSVNASRWDRRNSSTTGCGSEDGDGCSAGYTVDGLLNDVPDSRWSCSVESEEALPLGNPCVIDLDMGSSYTLTSVEIFFYKSDEEDRHINSFTLGVAEAGEGFTIVTSGSSLIPTPLGEGNSFPLGNDVTGRFVRMSSTTDDQWLSVNEVKIFADISTPAPVPITAPPVVPPTTQPVAPTAATQTPAPLATIAPTSANIATPSPMDLPTPAPTIMPASGNLVTPSPSAPPSPASTVMPSPVNVASPSPSAAQSPAPTTTSSPGNVASPSPSAAQSPAPTTTPSPGNVASPSPSEGCTTLIVTGAQTLSGEYVASEDTGSNEYIASGGVEAKIFSNENVRSECSSSSESDCTARMWRIKPDDLDQSFDYRVFDGASHPTLIKELWLRLVGSCPGGDNESCSYDAADVSIVCQDGSLTAAPTPAPATASTCAVVEVSGTVDGEWDGLYQAQDENGDYSNFVGFDVTNGGATVTANGNALFYDSLIGTCHNDSNNCDYQRWRVKGDGSDGRAYFTFDESEHPVDIAPGLWYTENTTLLPYDGEVTVSCSSSMATLIPFEAPGTPLPASPTPSPDDSGVGTSGEDSSRDAVSMAVIAGCAGGGLALLILLLALVVWRRRVALPQEPPPSYEDIVGGAK